VEVIFRAWTREKPIFHTNRDTTNPIELMFYSEGTVYPHLPSDADIERVRSRDYKVVIYGHRSEFPQYRNNPDIIFLAHDNK
jgi:hypothetical protein